MTETPEPKEKPTEKLSLPDRLADILLKLVQVGGVAGGGYGAFSALLKEHSDVPKAIASAAIGLGISYAARMLEPIHKGNERRLEGVGKGVDRAIDQGTGAIARKVMGVEDRYFQSQGWDCRRYRSEGMAQHDRIFTPLLEEVFVPLELDTSALNPGFRLLQGEALAEMSDRREKEIWNLLAKTQQEPVFRQIVILAWGGYGKTTLLKHIAYTYCMNQQGKYEVSHRRIPVLLVLRKYRDRLAPKAASDKPPSLPELITQQHIPSLPESEGLALPTSWAEEKLKRGEMVILLDGFDEVEKSQRSAVARWINDQMRRYGKSVFIVTSRPKAYQDQDTADRLELSTRLWVKDFNAKQRRRFVEQWYLCQERYAHGGDSTPDVQQQAQQASNDLLAQIEARKALQDLAKNPLLLNLIVTFHRRYPGAELPKRRVELYREICQLQLRDRPNARRLETLLTQCEAQTILQMLALEMMVNRQERIDRATLLEQLTQYLTEQGEVLDAKELLEQVVQVSELLVVQEDEYEFAHLSFQEYLAATQIVQRKQEKLLYDQFGNDWWKPTILFYASQLKNPSGLIREMVNRGAIDLAYICFQETTKRIDPAIVAELQAKQRAELKEVEQAIATTQILVEASRYQQLEDYLKAGQWKEADNETYRLMITTVGKEEGQYFEPDELLNFPCKELLEIDRLWVQYSNGQFGFSIQKKLYLECGGIPDGQYHEKEWDKFCHANGWQVNNKYVPVTFSTQAPRGHLPVGGGFVLWFGFLGVFSSLASRLVDCSTE